MGRGRTGVGRGGGTGALGKETGRTGVERGGGTGALGKETGRTGVGRGGGTGALGKDSGTTCKIWGFNFLCSGKISYEDEAEPVQTQVLHRKPHPNSTLVNLRNCFIKKELFYRYNKQRYDFMNIT